MKLDGLKTSAGNKNFIHGSQNNSPETVFDISSIINALKTFIDGINNRIKLIDYNKTIEDKEKENLDWETYFAQSIPDSKKLTLAIENSMSLSKIINLLESEVKVNITDHIALAAVSGKIEVFTLLLLKSNPTLNWNAAVNLPCSGSISNKEHLINYYRKCLEVIMYDRYFPSHTKLGFIFSIEVLREVERANAHLLIDNSFPEFKKHDLREILNQIKNMYESFLLEGYNNISISEIREIAKDRSLPTEKVFDLFALQIKG